jgi:hypothetical protein
MFSDQLPAGTPGVGICADAGVNCMGMARARYLDLINAALSGNPDEVAKAFHKYDAGSPHAWTQPATSDTADLSGTAGSFAPLWSDDGGNQGSIIYDRKLDMYLAVYQFGDIRIRASKDLIHWTEALATIPNPTSPVATTTRLWSARPYIRTSPRARRTFTSPRSRPFPTGPSRHSNM